MEAKSKSRREYVQRTVQHNDERLVLLGHNDNFCRCHCTGKRTFESGAVTKKSPVSTSRQQASTLQSLSTATKERNMLLQLFSFFLAAGTTPTHSGITQQKERGGEG
jgi:hypothetical protein